MPTPFKKWFCNLLRKSERYAKTDMVYLTKGSFWLSLSQMVGVLASLALAIAFANLISPELYGKYRYILSILGIISIATFPGFGTASIKSVTEGNEQIFWILLRKKFLWSTISTITSLGFFIYYLSNNNTELGVAFLIAAVFLPLASVSGMYSSLLNGRKDFAMLSKLAILLKIVTAGVIILTIYVTENLNFLVLAYFLPEVVVETIFLFKLKKKVPSTESLDISKLNKFGKFGLHLSFMEVLKTIASQIDKILVFHYLGAPQLATYAIATTAPGQIKGILQNMTTLALPKFGESNEHDIRETLPGKLFRLELLIVVLIILYWVVSPVLFPLFFPKYSDAVFLSQIYSLSLLFFPRTFLSTAMVAHMKQKPLYAIRIMAPAIRIAIFLIALPLWGVWGAIVGSIVGNALTAYIYQIFFNKSFPRDLIKV